MNPPRLTGEIKPVAALGPAERRQMLGLFGCHFGDVTAEGFFHDLGEKEAVVLLRDPAGRLGGFSTLMRLRARVGGARVAAFYSGDTVVAPAYWGYSALSRLWSRFVFAEAEHVRVRGEADAVYWLLVSSGPKTYRFLPTFYRRFYPTCRGPTPPGVRELMHALAAQKFGAQYDGGSGVVRPLHATPLRPGVAELRPKDRADPHVTFFLGANPGHAHGDELVCLTELSRANLTPAGLKMLGPAGCPETPA